MLPMMLSAQNLVPVQHKNGKWGYKESLLSDKFAIKPKFETARPFAGGHAFVCQKGLCGVISEDGKFVVKPKYASASIPFDGTTIVSLNSEFGLVKSAIEITVISFDEIKYIDAYGCFRVKSSGKYGLLDKQGKPLAKCEYDYITVGDNNTFYVAIKGKKGLLDQLGKVIVPAEYESVAHNAYNTFLVELGGKFGLLDEQGKSLSKCEYDEVKAFEKNYFLVKLGGKLGLLDKQGRPLTKVEYDEFKAGINNTFIFARNGKMGLLNQQGQVVVPANYDSIKADKSETYLVKLNSKYGLLDKNYKVCIEVKYDNIDYLQNGTFILVNNGALLFADAKGNKVDMPNNVIVYTTSNDTKMISNTHPYYDILNNPSLTSHIYGSGIGVLMFKNKVTSIGGSAFSGCKNLTSITIPDSVTSIRESAFYGCSSLTSITIPNSVTEIGWGAFSGCESLESVTIPNSVTWIGDNAFHGCSSLKSITIPDGIVLIRPGTFWGCCSLLHVTIPDSVTTIMDHAFGGCSGLVSMVIGKGIKQPIGYKAFAGCTGELTINSNIGGAYQYTQVYGGCVWLIMGAFRESNFTKVVIGGSVKYIGDNAFYNCKSLQEVVFLGIPPCLGNAFEDCFNLCVDYPNLSVLCKTGRVGLGGATVSKVCVNGKDIASFTKLVIPSDVTEIANSAFEDCGSLESVIIPNSVTKIGYRTFSGCSRLTSITIPNSVTEIGYEAFDGCSSLTSVTIGKGVEDIYDRAFYGCVSLKAVYLNATIPPYLGEEVFDYDAGRICCPIYVPSSSLNRYKGVGDNWIRYYRYLRGR